VTPTTPTPIPNNLTANKTPAALPGLPGGVYTFGIPLIIQDKTFVPPAAQLAAEDPTWNWGSEGNLWFPHVYMTNQWPDNPDNSGINPMGRWDLGAWFWPPMTSSTVAHVPVACSATPGAVIPATGGLCPPTPNPSLVPEAFMDTPVVNGVAYPTMTLPQGTYRFQILNAANDRMFNLSFFYAAEKSDQRIVCKPGYASWDTTGAPYTYAGVNDANCTEVKMVPAVPHPQNYTVGSAPTPPPPVETTKDADDALPACVNPAANPDVNRGSGFLAYANPNAYDYNSVTGMPGAVTPCWPSTWPTDGRDGGVPDPTTAGPAWVHIGTEGGVLPQAVVIPATPIGYNYNRRDVVVTNVQEHAVFLGPAERADVIVDFSQVPVGSTLILYNDSPAPVPGFDSRLDYYTGDVDQVSTGGAPSTQPGYGPNIRTIMQIQITAGSTTPYMTGAAATGVANLAGLQAAIPAIFTATQATPIIPETTYSAAGVITAPAKNTYARIQDMALTFTPAGIGAVPTTIDLKPKAIHELFENDYGKMNSILAEEIPLTNYNNQTTIPLAYVDPPTDFVADGETQLWKITHNGVDSHAIHFHLFNVQLINRTGWDGAIRPPDPNELGWKETVRMNPLEDAFVALQPKKMTLPAGFGVGESVRLLDPTRPEHATNVTGMPGFTNVDPNGNGITVSNEYTNFGWEYVWHCHLLGHEESDMMRPLVFQVLTPVAPDTLTATAVGTLGTQQTVRLNWKYIQGGTPGLTFTLTRSVNGAPYTTLATLIPATPPLTAGTTTTYVFNDLTAVAGATNAYQVVAVNGNAISGPANASITLAAFLGVPRNLAVASKTTTSITLTWLAPLTATGVTGYQIQRASNVNGPWTTVGTSTATNFRNSGLTTGTTYYYRVASTGALGAISAYTAPPLLVTTN
jgi:FtsP/CotA-like multicopper oxidase with cupredoxin domain